MVYDAKNDSRYKARLVAMGNMTKLEAILVGEMNGLKSMVGDIGNAYLEAYTKEKVCCTEGLEFWEVEGHTLVIVKAPYRLWTSGVYFHENGTNRYCLP